MQHDNPTTACDGAAHLQGSRRARANVRRANRCKPTEPLGRAARCAVVEMMEQRVFLSATPQLELLHAGTPSANVNVSRLAGNQVEVALAVNPANPANLIAAANDMRDVSEKFVWYSLDAGNTWKSAKIPGLSNVHRYSTVEGLCDPSLVFDRQGNAYFALLAQYGAVGMSAMKTTIAVSRSGDGGQTWQTQLVPTPEFTSPDPVTGATRYAPADKEMLAVGQDPTNPSKQRLYVSYQVRARQYINFSTDGIVWSNPVQVSDGDSSGINAQPAVAPNGTVYLAWQEINGGTPGVSRVFFDVSTDGGQTWGTDRVAYTSNVSAFFDRSFAGPVQRYRVPAAPERGMGAFLAMDVDSSGGSRNGTIYMVVLDQADHDGVYSELPDEHHNTDVFVIRSSDGGNTWSAPVRVNDDTTIHSQFTPWLDLDQTTGNVAVGWYDARNDNGAAPDADGPNTDVEFFAAVSVDGAQTFLPNLRLSQGRSDEDGAEPYPAGFADMDYGEYPGLAFHDGIVYAAWADNSNWTGDNPDGTLGKQDVYFAKARLTSPLFIFGGTGADSFQLSPAGAGKVNLFRGGSLIGVYSNVSRVVMYGYGGNDVLDAAESLNVPVEFHGGPGNDLLRGGMADDLLFGDEGDDRMEARKGNDILVGGPGNDVLRGVQGWDIVIGGTGADWLFADEQWHAGGQDLLITGSTIYDNDVAALETLRAEWTRSAADYTVRIANLAAGVAGGSLFLRANESVQNDGDAVDWIFAYGERDWFFASRNDKITDQRPDEQVVWI